MSKLKLEMTGTEAVTVLSGGNPGAMTAMLLMLEHGKEIDPNCIAPVLHLALIDDLGIAGSDIWVLFSDICGKSVPAFIGVLRAYQLGFTTKMDIRLAISQSELTRKNDLDVKGLLEKVKQQLPKFNMELVV